MIFGYFHQGSGVGNQLHRYVATRVKAQEVGVDWRMIYNPDGSGKTEGFKCREFMNFDEDKLIQITELDPSTQTWNEKKVVESGVDIRPYDPEFNFIQDNTVIDGEFQDSRYFEDYLDEIDEWLEVKPIKVPDDICVIGFRGGEFKVFPELFLTKQYWNKAILVMSLEHGDLKYEVHTDDPETAREFFPDYPIVCDVEKSWRTLRYAKKSIISNSSFYIFPRLLKHHEDTAFTIAPRYFARRNTGVWALPQNFYKKFLYI